MDDVCKVYLKYKESYYYQVMEGIASIAMELIVCYMFMIKTLYITIIE